MSKTKTTNPCCQEDLHRSLVEVKFLQMEKAEYLEQISKLKAALKEAKTPETGPVGDAQEGVKGQYKRIREDSDVEFRLPSHILVETSGYISAEEGEVKSLKSHLKEKDGEFSLFDWTTPRRDQGLQASPLFGREEGCQCEPLC